MNTRGTNPEMLRAMTDSQLRRLVREAGLDVVRVANNPNATDFEIQFSIGTLNHIGHEIRVRAASASEHAEMVPQ